MAARWNINKDFELLFSSLNTLSNKRKDFIVLLCGKNIDQKNIELQKLINKFNIKKFIKLLGPITKMNKFYNKLDINLLVSKSESFPNVIVEAGLMNVYNLASDVGDIKFSFKNYVGIFKNTKNSLTNKLDQTITSIKKDDPYLKLKKMKFKKLISSKYTIEKQISLYNEIYGE